MTELFNTIFYQPLYNALVFLVDVSPGASLGFAVIFLTLLVKIILFPLSHKSVSTQAKIRTLDPHIKKIREETKDNKQEQAKKTMELYQRHGVNPFSGCFLLVVQLPIIFALYWVFLKGIKPDSSLLYSFISFPGHVNTLFLGFIDMHGKSILLALLAGITQFLQIRLSMPPIPTESSSAERSFKDELAKSMSVQMRYVMPVLVAFIAYTISSAVALYWVTSNCFSIGHELFVRRKAKKLLSVEV
ncbi:MAG: YidC/Oxa1 family membrane protein insertase [Parcubacteria group bacterium]|nr:YidC/Oxa1 family membrane protein insertase [Parcubacteria group bacterium]